jgi:hypothetical protein
VTPTPPSAALRAAAAVFTVAAAALLMPTTAFGHVSLVPREDLPLPDWLLYYGTLVIIVVSFVGLVLGWKRPHFEGLTSRPVDERLSRLLVNPFTEVLAGLIGVGLAFLVVYAGLEGTDAADRNFTGVFVPVTFAIGTAVLSVLFGDVFRAFNPWRAIGRAVSGGLALIAGQRLPAPLTYPERLGRWPAAIGWVAFLFLELVWGQTGFGLVSLSPHDIAVAALAYSAYTFTAMALFGVDRWIDRGEIFSQYFGMFASLSAIEVREGLVRLRRPLSGATTWALPAGSLALVLVAIGGTTFDGAQEGLLNDAINSLYISLQDGGLSPTSSLRLANTTYLLVTLAAVAAIFWAGILGMRIVERKRSPLELARQFAHAFIPIALAYLIAHYFSYFYLLQQAQFGYLLSNPLGTAGTDLFGTADNGIDLSSISAGLVQWVQFGSIVIGHVISLALGHDRALKIWGNTRDAAWSQVWMLLMMMAFSILGLLLLSEANA